MYQCDEQKQFEKEQTAGQHKGELPPCCHCTHFMNEADACIEDSVIAPVYHIIYSNTEYAHFNDNGSNNKPPVIIHVPGIITTTDELETHTVDGKSLKNTNKKIKSKKSEGITPCQYKSYGKLCCHFEELPQSKQDEIVKNYYTSKCVDSIKGDKK